MLDKSAVISYYMLLSFNTLMTNKPSLKKKQTPAISELTYAETNLLYGNAGG